ncbi:MAG: type II secretion system protein M [Pseudomonadota bacterium]
MIAQFRSWWGERSLREQWMLVFMVTAIAAFLMWFAVLMPLANGLERARARHNQAVVDLATVRGKASALKTILAKPALPLGAPVPAFVSQSAGEAGFTLSRTDPVGTNGVVIAIVAAKSPAMFDWLNNLDARGIFVSQLTIRTNSDMTIAVDATLNARGE